MVSRILCQCDGIGSSKHREVLVRQLQKMSSARNCLASLSFQSKMDNFEKTVEERTKAGQLMKARGLIDSLLLSAADTQRQRELLLGQAREAKRRGDQGWLNTVSRDANTFQFAEREWICDNIFDVPRPRCKESSLEPLKDARMARDPSLQRVVSDAAESGCAASGEEAMEVAGPVPAIETAHPPPAQVELRRSPRTFRSKPTPPSIQPPQKRGGGYPGSKAGKKGKRGKVEGHAELAAEGFGVAIGMHPKNSQLYSEKDWGGGI